MSDLKRAGFKLLWIWRLTQEGWGLTAESLVQNKLSRKESLRGASQRRESDLLTKNKCCQKLLSMLLHCRSNNLQLQRRLAGPQCFKSFQWLQMVPNFGLFELYISFIFSQVCIYSPVVYGPVYGNVCYHWHCFFYIYIQNSSWNVFDSTGLMSLCLPLLYSLKILLMLTNYTLLKSLRVNIQSMFYDIV